jgi:hypothetical protein
MRSAGETKKWGRVAERRRFAAFVVSGLGFTGHAQEHWKNAVDGDLAAGRSIDYALLRRAADKHLRDRLVVEFGLSEDDVETFLPPEEWPETNGVNGG